MLKLLSLCLRPSGYTDSAQINMETNNFILQFGEEQGKMLYGNFKHKLPNFYSDMLFLFLNILLMSQLCKNSSFSFLLRIKMEFIHHCYSIQLNRHHCEADALKIFIMYYIVFPLAEIERGGHTSGLGVVIHARIRIRCIMQCGIKSTLEIRLCCCVHVSASLPHCFRLLPVLLSSPPCCLNVIAFFF